LLIWFCVFQTSKVLPAFFSLAANLRVQDVSGDAQHISMLPIIDIVSCHAHSGLSTFVWSAITTLCFFNASPQSGGNISSEVIALVLYVSNVFVVVVVILMCHERGFSSVFFAIFRALCF
jgi:hypothetical protein